MEVGSGASNASLHYNQRLGAFLHVAAGSELLARYLSGVGTVLGSGIVVSEELVEPRWASCDSEAGRYLATWRELTTLQLRGRVFTENGGFVGDSFVISEHEISSRHARSAAFDPVGARHLVVFASHEAEGAYLQFVDRDGIVDGPAHLVVGTPYAIEPVVAYDPVHALFLVAWSERGEVYAQLFARSGAPLDSPVLLQRGDIDDRPRIGANTRDGGFLVVMVNRDDAWAQRIVIEAG